MRTGFLWAQQPRGQLQPGPITLTEGRAHAHTVLSPCPGGTRSQVLLQAGCCHPGGRAVRPAILKDRSRPLLALWHGGRGNHGAEEARARNQRLCSTRSALGPAPSPVPTWPRVRHSPAVLLTCSSPASQPNRPLAPLFGGGTATPPAQLRAQRCCLPAQSCSVPSRRHRAARLLNTGLSVQRARQDREHAGKPRESRPDRRPRACTAHSPPVLITPAFVPRPRWEAAPPPRPLLLSSSSCHHRRPRPYYLGLNKQTHTPQRSDSRK